MTFITLIALFWLNLCFTKTGMMSYPLIFYMEIVIADTKFILNK